MDELAQRLWAAGIEPAPKQLEAIREMVSMIAAARGAYDPIEAVIVLLKPPGAQWHNGIVQ